MFNNKGLEFNNYPEFDPDDISKDAMLRFGKNINDYLNLLMEVMIIPEEVRKESGKRIKESIENTKKLIKKLKKGESEDIFKDPEDCNIIR